MKTKFKTKKLKMDSLLIGETLETNKHGHAGRQIEDILEDYGMDMNRGPGVDIPSLNVEVKSREITATSAHTVADMVVADIINTDYKNSYVYEKIQQQFRVHTLNNVVVSAEVYDFSADHIQELLEAGYENARQQLIQNSALPYTSYTGFYGYFERVKGHTAHSFRLSDRDMKTLEGMSKSTYTNLFTNGTS